MKDNEIIDLLSRNFNLSLPKDELISESEIFERIKSLLSEKIKFLIRTDLDKLLQILYRIDLDQMESDQAFELGEINAVSNRLAERIIYRQLKKREYSKKFYQKD